MIFTHIFSYLDDREAAEELRRSSRDNSRSPALNSRFQDSASCREHQYARFKQFSSVQALSPNASVGKVLHTPRSKCLDQGFASLRAESPRPSHKPRVLPPICGSQVTGGDKQLAINDQTSAKLPPIERSQAQPSSNGNRPRSRRRRSGDNAQNRCQDHQYECLSPIQVRDREVNKCDKKVMAENLTDHLSTEENVSGQKHKTASFQDMSVAKAGIKKDYHEGFQQTVKQYDFDTKTEVESAKTNEITADESCTERSCSASEQSSGKEWATTKGDRKTKIEDVDFYKRLELRELNKGELSSFSDKRNQEDRKLSYSTWSTQNSEYLHMKSNQTVSRGDIGSLATKNVKKMCNLELVAFERGRRNAICEVLEKRLVPQFGSSLYEMRQNLIQLS